MIERDMEDLISSFPDDFFPREQFKLLGRQESFAGVGRFDLLFTDQHDFKVLMELKVRTLRYEDATQVAKYRDELGRLGHKNVWMWLVVRKSRHQFGRQANSAHAPTSRLTASFAMPSPSPPKTFVTSTIATASGKLKFSRR